MAFKGVPESSDRKGRELDPIGQILAVLMLASLAFVMIEGPHLGWTSVTILAVAAVALAVGVAFFWFEAGREGALVPLDVFRNRHFDAALAVAAMMTFGMYAVMFLMPLYLQSIAGASAAVAGLELVPMSLVFVAVSQFSGALMQRIGARLMMVGGMSCLGVGMLMLATIAADTSLATIEAALVVLGIGLGLNTGPVNAVAVASLEPARSGTASGLFNTARMIGATFGIAVLGAIFAVYAGQNSTGGVITGLRLAHAGGAAAAFIGATVAAIFTRAESAKQKRG
jgi:MFS family permease